MNIVILAIHVFLALALIGTILLQPPESSSLGGLGSSNPLAGGGGRGQGNLLTRMTAILAGAFIVTSLILAIIAGHKTKNASILDEANTAPAVSLPAAPVVPTVPAEQKAPSVPLAQ